MMRRSNRIELVQGTLDLLVLRILLFGPFHGHAIGKQIRSA
jgi:PadR family transcriptional regulator, regulatory protein PadR